MSNPELIRPTVTGSYAWRIPTLSPSQSRLLCSGWFRCEFQEIYHLPRDIINLCILYFNTSDITLNHLQKGIMQKYTSNIFHLDSVPFIMVFDSEVWKIIVPYLPPNVVSIEFTSKLEIISTRLQQIKQNVIGGTKKLMSFSYYNSTFSNYIKDISYAPIELKLTMFDMRQFDAKQNIIAPSKPYQVMTDSMFASSGFVWNITNKSQIKSLQHSSAGAHITSPLFLCENLKWMMKISYFDDVDADICVYLASLSPNIKRLCIAYKISFDEINKHSKGTHVFGNREDEGRNRSMSLWEIEFFKNKEIADLKQITLKMEISLVKIFYNEGYIAPKQHNIHNKQSLHTLNGEFSWIVDNVHEIQHMKAAKNTEEFMSPFFEMKVFKWCLKVYPNGYNQGNIGRMNTFLRLVSFPPNISAIAVQYQLCILETNTIFTAIERYCNDSPSFGWTANLLKLEDVQKITRFTYKARIKIIDIFDKDGNIITHQYVDTQHDNHTCVDPHFKDMKLCTYYMKTPCVYEWKITDETAVKQIKSSKNGFNFLSKMFVMLGLKWYLEFIPIPSDRDPEFDADSDEYTNDYSVLYLCCASISPNIGEIRINYTLGLVETDTVYANCTELDTCYSTGWARDTLKRKEINALDGFTFRTTIDFIDIYDVNGANVTHEYIHNGANTNICNRLVTDRYEWKIEDIAMMEAIKSAQNGDFIISEMFVMHGLKWKMKIYPNGTKPQRIGVFNWYFNLVSIPPNISKISLFYKIVESQTQAMDLDKTEMRCSSSQFGWGQNKLKFKDIMELKRLSFALEVKIIDIFDENGDKMNVEEYKQISQQLIAADNDRYKMHVFEWRVTDQRMINKIKCAKIGEELHQNAYYEMSEYSFKWFMKIAPNGINKEEKGQTKLFLCLQSLPDHIESLSLYFELNVVDNVVSYSNYAHFRNDKLCKTWLTSQIKMEQLQQLKQLRFQAKIQIIDIYYKKQIF